MAFEKENLFEDLSIPLLEQNTRKKSKGNYQKVMEMGMKKKMLKMKRKMMHKSPLHSKNPPIEMQEGLWVIAQLSIFLKWKIEIISQVTLPWKEKNQASQLDLGQESNPIIVDDEEISV